MLLQLTFSLSIVFRRIGSPRPLKAVDKFYTMAIDRVQEPHAYAPSIRPYVRRQPRTAMRAEVRKILAGLKAAGKVEPFMDVLRDCRVHGIDVGTVHRVEQMFEGHPDLLADLMKFFPADLQGTVPVEEDN